MRGDLAGAAVELLHTFEYADVASAHGPITDPAGWRTRSAMKNDPAGVRMDGQLITTGKRLTAHGGPCAQSPFGRAADRDRAWGAGTDVAVRRDPAMACLSLLAAQQ
jgi:hypothetical protein